MGEQGSAGEEASGVAWVFPGMSSSFADWYREAQDYWEGLAGHLDADGRWPGGIDDEVAHLRFSRPRTLVPVEPGQGPVSAAERMRRYRARRKGAP